jgi:Zn finger protein HypA/HybF involved in hydrogenase expression
MATVIIPEETKCLRCGHQWTPRKAEVTRCPKCGSPYWNRPKRTPKQK